MQRDNNLDIYRGFAIIWVLFIHCIYWTGYFSSTYVVIIKSFFLFEMPLFFLITGAGTILSNKKRSLSNFYSKRFARVIIPYWVFALICVIFIQLPITYLQSEGKVEYISWFLIFGAFTRWSNYPYLTWHLWFIPVFLLIIFIIPLLLKWFNFLKRFFKVIPLIFFSLVIIYLDIFDFSKEGNLYWIYFYLKTIAFYSFWIYIGFFYKYIDTSKIKIRYPLIIIGSSIIITIGLLNIDYYSYDMQDNKFPPNLIFLTFNIITITILYLSRNLLIKIIEILNLKTLFIKFGKNTYTVFLYHPFAFLFGGMILSVLQVDFSNVDLVGLVFYLIVAIVGSNIFINLFSKIESHTFKDLKNIFRV